MIYLDNHATTPCDPRVLNAMTPYFLTAFGNAGSVNHRYGAEAKDAVETARRQVAELIAAAPREIVFTSGATESNNLAIKGIVERSLAVPHGERRPHVVSVATEHPAVLDPLEALQRRGVAVSLLPVKPHGDSRAGEIDLDRLEQAITPQTVLVSAMLANNEIGVIQPLSEIAEICRRRHVPLHTDATQAVGRIPVNVNELGVDLLSLSAHKMYGPKGVGALYIRRRRPALKLTPLIDGGGQERGLRSGTLNVPGIAGLGAAAKLAAEEMSDEAPRIAELKMRLFETLIGTIRGLELIGPALEVPGLRLPGNLNLHFPALDGESLMLAAPEIAVSSGAACASTKEEPSHVLRALGLTPDQSRCCLRFGVGRMNTAEETDQAAEMLAAAAARLGRFA